MINYVKGDLFAAVKDKSNIIIPHICNDIGAWGAGFVLPLAKHFPQTREKYLGLKSLRLGATQIVRVDEDAVIYVGNMIAQHSVGLENGRPPIRYAALAKCMDQVTELAKFQHCSIHAPMFGSGLAGGNWDLISTLIEEIWCDQGISVTIYSLE